MKVLQNGDCQIFGEDGLVVASVTKAATLSSISRAAVAMVDGIHKS
jgi:hypothetical protein